MASASQTVTVGELAVKRLGLGTMSLTGAGVWGDPLDPKGARRLLRRARELGVDFFDTADSYGPGVSETLVSEALYPYDDVVIATKGGLTRQGPGRWSRNCRPEYLRAACEASLLRLRVDRIDLYQLHTVDPAIPLEESLGALVELQAEGKIKHIGVCNVGLPELQRAMRVTTVAFVQNRFSLADRSSLDVVKLCERSGIGFVAWAPLGKGPLATGDRTLAAFAADLGWTSAQTALAWILHVSPVTIAIPGTARISHLEENVAAMDLRLEPERVQELARHSYRAGHGRRRRARALGRVTSWARR